MTLHLLHSEFPYIRGNFYFLFYQCMVMLIGLVRDDHHNYMTHALDDHDHEHGYSIHVQGHNEKDHVNDNDHELCSDPTITMPGHDSDHDLSNVHNGHNLDVTNEPDNNHDFDYDHDQNP
jgi:hypothetical protein